MKVSLTHNRRLRDNIKVAIAQETNANQAVQDFRKRLEDSYGFPIVFERLGANASSGGTVRSYWEQRTHVRHHSIDLECVNTNGHLGENRASWGCGDNQESI